MFDIEFLECMRNACISARWSSASPVEGISVCTSFRKKSPVAKSAANFRRASALCGLYSKVMLHIIVIF